MVVRSAVIGGGTVSRSHLGGIQKNPRTELVAVCDLDEDVARERAREFGTMATTDLASLLDGNVDCVHVCTPVRTHFDIARQAIENDVAVVLEKPATLTVEEVEELLDLSRTRDVPVTVIHNHLFYPVVRRVRELIEGGELGQLRGVDTIYSGITPPDEVSRGSWVVDLPGGEFEEALPHPIYSILGIGGFPRSVEDVSAQTVLSREYDDGYDYDQAQVQYVSETGTLCSVTMVSETPYQRLHVINGTERSIVLDEVNQSIYSTDVEYPSFLARSKKGFDVSAAQLSSTVRNAKSVIGSRLSDDWADEARANSHYAIFDQFAKAIELGADVPVPLEQAKWSIQLMESIRESAEREETAAEASVRIGQ